MMDWTLFESVLVATGMYLFAVAVGSTYYLIAHIVDRIKIRKIRRELKIIRPRKEYFDYEKALYEYVMKD
jgi:citrate synthase